jgi:NTE family protein
VPSLAHDPGSPRALVLSGGGARGAFQVGVWDVLCSHPRGLRGPPEVLSGTSAGSINAYLIAAGLTPQRMLEFWMDLARMPPVMANASFFRSLGQAVQRLLVREPVRSFKKRVRDVRIFASLLRKHSLSRLSGLEAVFLEFVMTARFDNVSDVLERIETAYLFDTAPLKDRLVEATGRPDLRHTTARLAINTIDVRTGSVVRIVNHRPEKSPKSSTKHYRYEPVITPAMVLASASIPLLFNPVHVGDQYLWDGGLLVNTPMAPAVALGAHRIVPVLVTPRNTETTGRLTTFGNAVERLADAFLENAYSNDRKLLLDRNALAARTGDPELREIQLFRAVRPTSSRTFNAASYLYFEPTRLQAMFHAGQAAARAWLDAGPLLDSRDAEA